MKKINIVVADRNPLLLNGIISFLHRYPDLYHIDGQFLNINAAVELCMHNRNIDLLLLGEFPEHLASAEMIRWLISKNVKARIIAYIEKNTFINCQSILEAGAKGLVWKNSHPTILNRAIDSVTNGYIFCDDGLTETDSAIRRPASEKFLTVRERQVLQLIADGKTNKEIAKLLTLSNKTIETHRLNIMKKLDVHNGIGLLKAALRLGVCTI